MCIGLYVYEEDVENTVYSYGIISCVFLSAKLINKTGFLNISITL